MGFLGWVFRWVYPKNPLGFFGYVPGCLNPAAYCDRCYGTITGTITIYQSFTLMHCTEFVEWTPMPLSTDTCMALSNIVLDGGPGYAPEMEILGSESPVTIKDAAFTFFLI